MSGDACGKRRLRPLVWFGVSGDPCDGAPVVSPVTHVTKFRFFSKIIYGNAKSDRVFWLFLGGLGVLVAPFWQHFGGVWDPNGCIFLGFWGSGGVLGRLGRAVCARKLLTR